MKLKNGENIERNNSLSLKGKRKSKYYCCTRRNNELCISGGTYTYALPWYLCNNEERWERQICVLSWKSLCRRSIPEFLHIKKKKEKKIYFRKEEQQHTRASCVVGLQSSLVMARLCNKETNFYYTVNNDNNLVNVDYIHKVVNSSCGYNKGHDFHLHPAR